VPWRLWIPWIDSDRNKARRSKKRSPQVISSCYFLLDGSPKLITHNLFATEFCHGHSSRRRRWRRTFLMWWLRRAIKRWKSCREETGLWVSIWILSMIWMSIWKHVLKSICLSLRFQDLYIFTSYELLLCWWLELFPSLFPIFDKEKTQSCNGFDEFMSCPSKHAIELNLLRWWMRWNVSLWRYSSSRWMRWQQQLRPVGILQVGDSLGPFSLSP